VRTNDDAGVDEFDSPAHFLFKISSVDVRPSVDWGLDVSGVGKREGCGWREQVGRNLMNGPAALAAMGVLLTGCGILSPKVAPDPNDARTSPIDDSQVATLETGFEAPTIKEYTERSQRALLPDEIDRRIREELAGDPLALVRSVNQREALPLVVNDHVAKWINYFETVIPERFGLYLERKGRWERMIRHKLREANMPQDFIYLALIESGMNPFAYSRARAVGMWQFISSTAHQYDLEVSFWIDERRDPEKSTDSALRYLSDLYGQFDSWYLAAAAYNAGPGRVRRGLRRVEDGTFWDLADTGILRRETQDYVPKLVAASIIGNNPERYGFGHIVKQGRDDIVTVTVPDATSFDVLAEAAGTDENMIRELNPQFPQRVTPPNRAVTIRIPGGGANEFGGRYAAVPHDERVTWTYHVVTRGQTLGEIGRRYGVTVVVLRAANGDVNPRRLSIGQRLVIPNPARLASRQASNSSVSSDDGGSSTLERNSGSATVVVRRGDSLWLIARRFSVSTHQLMEWNGLSSSTIHPGDRLEVKR
jgi:membrane-bound lytic murein transglycosylase D